MRTDEAGSDASGASSTGRPFVSLVGGRRIELTLAVAMSVFSVVFVLQSLPAVQEQWRWFAGPLGVLLLVLVYGTTALAALAALLRHWTQQVFLGVAIVYLVALALWPLAVEQALAPGAGGLPMAQVLANPQFNIYATSIVNGALTLGGPTPWLLVLTTMPLGFLVIARRDWAVPGVYALVTCAVHGYYRMRPIGGGVDVWRALFDGVFALALDIALLALVFALRAAARSVDVAQARALQRYADAQIDKATEQERVQIDALVHDRVLTTFLTAARADSAAERALAVGMAADAIRQLTSADRQPVEVLPVTLDGIAGAIRAEAGPVADLFRFSIRGDATREVPGPVADAITSAAVQAMVNSANHAGGRTVPRSIRLVAGTDGGVTVSVADEGAGFDMERIPMERLGVRVSILERMQTAGGTAEIHSVVGRGTTVALRWSAQELTGPVPMLLEPQAVLR